jgi:uncharacterized protein YjbI with pentapeptide repeats
VYQQPQPRWKRFLWLGGILVALLVVLVLIRIGYAPSWTSFTGFGEREVKQDVQPTKTLWDWLDLLIVPIVLAIGGYLFTRSESHSTQASAERRALDDTLQAYLDGMSQLVTDKEQPLHSAQPGDSLSTLARARTLTVLSRLDSGRKRSVLEFLYESGLIDQGQALFDESDLIERRHNIISLQGANLRGANLSYPTNLSGANLGGTNLRGANLRGANLGGANLRGANLRGANLIAADLIKANLSSAHSSHAYLNYADLIDADLSGADLSSAYLVETKLISADLSKADLSEAYLIGAYLGDADLSKADLSDTDLSNAQLRFAKLIDADLSGADLSGADLSGANLSTVEGITGEELDDQASLEGATMPNGQKYEDWLKSKDQE